jgi:hypothetical protein
MKPVILAFAMSVTITVVAGAALAADDDCVGLACRLKNSDRKGGSGGPLNPQSIKPVDDAVLEKDDGSKTSKLRTVP